MKRTALTAALLSIFMTLGPAAVLAQPASDQPATATPAPDKPDETDPDGAKTPDSTTTPDGTPAPDGTAAPDGTTAPDGTPDATTPIATDPVTTPVPDTTPAPDTALPAAPPPPPPPPAPAATATDPEPAAASVTKAATPRSGVRLSGGFKGGLSLGTQIGDGAEEASFRRGTAVGAYLQFPLAVPGLSIQPELFMLDKGADYPRVQGIDTSESLLYLEVPVLVRYDFELSKAISLYGVVGPAVDLLLDVRFADNEDVNRIDVNGVVGVGVNIRAGTRRVAAEIRASQGLLNTVAVDDTEDKIHNRLIALLASLSL